MKGLIGFSRGDKSKSFIFEQLSGGKLFLGAMKTTTEKSREENYETHEKDFSVWYMDDLSIQIKNDEEMKFIFDVFQDEIFYEITIKGENITCKSNGTINKIIKKKENADYVIVNIKGGCSLDEWTEK